MSLILKALQKVEKEKGQERQEQPSFGESPVAREILNEIPPPEVSMRSRSRLPLIFLVLLAGGFLGGILLLRNSNQQPSEKERDAKEISSVFEQKAPVVTAPAIPAVEPPPAVVIAPAVPVVSAVPADSPEPAATPETPAAVVVEPSSPKPGVSPEETVSAENKPAPAVRKKNAAAKRPVSQKVAVAEPEPAIAPITEDAIPVSRTTAVASVSLPSRTADKRTGLVGAPVVSHSHGWALNSADLGPTPELRITEIHYRPLAKDRLAVVNGLPVLEGVDIEGARVDRIFKDRIRFVFNGRYLEVKLDSGATP